MKCAGLRPWLRGLACGLSQAYGTCSARLGVGVALALLVLEPLLFASCAWAAALSLPFAARFAPQRFEQGLYLFNPLLFGCFAFATLGPGVASLAAITVAVPLIVLLALRLDTMGWRAYFTVPYIAAAHLTVITLDGRLPAFPVVPVNDSLLGGVVRSFSQVLLSADFGVGAVVLAAALVALTLPAVAAIAASALLSAAWIASGLPSSAEAAGLVGYNAVIFTLYVGNEIVSRLPQYAIALLAGTLAHGAFYAADVAAYTFPFVVSGWVYLGLSARRRGLSADPRTT